MFLIYSFVIETASDRLDIHNLVIWCTQFSKWHRKQSMCVFSQLQIEPHFKWKFIESFKCYWTIQCWTALSSTTTTNHMTVVNKKKLRRWNKQNCFENTKKNTIDTTKWAAKLLAGIFITVHLHLIHTSHKV